jgi:DNA helicase HerA-like ATPase
MNTESTLLSKIFDITKGDLANEYAPWPPIDLLYNKYYFVKIKRFSLVIGSNSQVESIEHQVEDLVSALHSQHLSFVYMIIGDSNNVHIYYGIDKKAEKPDLLTNILGGVFSDVRLAIETPPFEPVEKFDHAKLVSGVPSTKNQDSNRQHTDCRLERLCRGLFGQKWAYIVLSDPINAITTIERINQITNEIRDVHSQFLLKGSPIDEKNRFAQRYIELLENSLKRYENGRVSGMWNSEIYFLAEKKVTAELGKSILHGSYSGNESTPVPIRVIDCQKNEKKQLNLEPINTKECSLFSFPPQEEFPGYEVVEYTRFGVQSKNYYLDNNVSVRIGEIMDRGMQTGNYLKLPLNDLTKHGLIVGVTGSGKTNSCFSILEQTWNYGKGIPFLVIESAKSEYRQLSSSQKFSNIKIFTVGDERVSPLRLNPFEVPDGVLVQTHIDYLKSLFSASFVLYPPMPYVLEQSIQEIYQDCGWNLSQNYNSRGSSNDRLYPTLNHLAKKIEAVVERMGYDSRITMDVKAGLMARVNQLRIGGGKGPMFNTRKSIDPSILFDHPCIIELKQIVNDDEKAFIIVLILIRLYEYRESNTKPIHGNLLHITLIEEAHRLLRNVSTEQGSEITANPKGRAIEVFTNILSEIRAYGEGFLIAEQIPTKLTPDAIKNTNLKIIHRLVSEDDRKAVGGTMNIDDQQSRFLTTLEPGNGVAYTEGSNKPILLQFEKKPLKDSFKSVSIADIKESMSAFWASNIELLAPYFGCHNCSNFKNGKYVCDYLPHLGTDQILQQAFLRLFNTLRLSKPLVYDAYSDYRLMCMRDPGPKNNQYIYCSLSEFVELEIEKRGDYWGWAFKSINDIYALTTDILYTLNDKYKDFERKNIEKEYVRKAG